MGKNYIGLTTPLRYEAMAMLKEGYSVAETARHLGVDVGAVRSLAKAPKRTSRQLVAAEPDPVSEENILVEAVYAAIRAWKDVRVYDDGDVAVCRFCGQESQIDESWHASQHPHKASCLVKNGSKIAAIIREHSS